MKAMKFYNLKLYSIFDKMEVSGKSKHLFSRKKLMIDPISPASQENFLPGNIPPHSDGFYNSKQFAQNESHFLSTLISIDDRAQQRGLRQIKEAVDGQS